jgi:hypothetical protein
MHIFKLSTIVFGTILALGDAVSATNISLETDAPLILYVAVQSQGILTMAFDPSKPASESLSVLATNTDGGFQPGWLTSRGDKLISISRNATAGVQSRGHFLFSKIRSNEYNRCKFWIIANQ